jgi:hypothetical protein
MPRPIILADEDAALEHLQNVLKGDPEVAQWIKDGYVYSVTVVEIDDVTPDYSNVPRFQGVSVEEAWMHDCHVALCQFSSASQLSKRGTVFCWRFGKNKIMSVDFRKKERDLGLYLQRFIDRRTAEAEVVGNVGTPTASVGIAKSTEFGDDDEIKMAENLAGLAQSRIRQCKELGKNQLVGVSESHGWSKE